MSNSKAKLTTLLHLDIDIDNEGDIKAFYKMIMTGSNESFLVRQLQHLMFDVKDKLDCDGDWMEIGGGENESS